MTDKLLSSVISPEVQGRSAATGEIAQPSLSMAKRLDTLENKTVYLVDNGFGGGPQFMQQLQKWFAEHIPSVTTICTRKTGHVFSDDNADLWEEIKAKGHAVVYGVAG